MFVFITGIINVYYQSLTKPDTNTEIVCVDIIQVGRQDPFLFNTIGSPKLNWKRIIPFDSKFQGSVPIH